MDERGVVAHRNDGKIVRGRTWDFRPERAWFQIHGPEGDHAERVVLDELKAIFFVRSLDGNSKYDESKSFEGRQRTGRKTWVEFTDGEVVAGWVELRDIHPHGFFLEPVDPDSNNERLFVVSGSVKQVLHDDDAQQAARSYRSAPNARSLVGRVPESAWSEFMEQREAARPKDDTDISGVFLQDF